LHDDNVTFGLDRRRRSRHVCDQDAFATDQRKATMLSGLVAAFIAGFLAVLVFHQGVWAIFAAAGKTPAPAWDMTATGPLKVPQVISAAFWGGLWGVVLALLLPTLSRQIGYWPTCIIVGSLLTSLVALLIIFPMKGRKFAAGWNPAIWIFALLVNAAWGFGFGLFYPPLSRLM
jgi:MFS-type transporter involved in bile tolerance (Atg22 family)